MPKVLSGDGKCLAYFKNGSLRVLPTGTYEVDDLGLPVTAQSAEMAWVPVAN